ncbi:cellulose synthase-like protein G2 [Andrographis paniculata]|uniref:cellulose synthase-like protein G2 n=1 Tax=Andrographis paniculata TaxID=175694 RepID=UPI0021E831A7|nr:cellulose synthase-like protein G2 [Andrographis paniculata]XP_051129971.1 cellulose synthase-like protein G2 [Andrographis paniculata]
MDEASLPLNERVVMLKDLVINRLHMLLNGIAILSVFYYRATTLWRIIQTGETPVVAYLVVIVAEIVLTFMWILHQAYRWIPVRRIVYPERLPEDEKLPRVDVFVCTADPSKEPSLGVMNTVISAMSLDYPPDKLAVYLQDDGGSYVTLSAVRESWKFSRVWIPFCRRYKLKIRCPEAYFSAKESADEKFIGSSEFEAEKKLIAEKFREFQKVLEKNSVNASSSVSRNHPPTIEVMTDEDPDLKEMPLLVYVSREKRPGHPHHFKGGALNTLLRVSALLSNAPYFLVLDCDMYCYDPSSARQAMCYLIDPKTSPQLGWVQFPQKFRNTSEHDIYDGQLNQIWREGKGYDGSRGPNIYGCNAYIKREAIYRSDKLKKDVDVSELKKSFGASNEFIKSLLPNFTPLLAEDRKPSPTLEKELQLVASCTYDSDSEWGDEIGYKYFTVVEDAITSLILHCKGWFSVYLDPEIPCFLGSCTTCLTDMLAQQTRWAFGLMQMTLSKYNPLTYGPLRMSIFQSMCYGAVVFDAFFSIPFYGLAIIPPICLVYGIPLYPKVSDPFFIAFVYIFLSTHLKHVQEVLSYANASVMNAVYETRAWMMKSGVAFMYGLSNAILEKFGLHEGGFSLTNKADDDEQERRYREGIYDFQVSPMLIIPLCTLYNLNLACLAIGLIRLLQRYDEFFLQACLSFYGVALNIHFFQGMFLRTDTGRVSPYVTLLSIAVAAIIFCIVSLLLV